ncbi:VOC family protein [Marinitenerispora sediminis]|uniref:Glyxoylase n=1 Tax=Marinitenerispora sediminis TaxID=1931232 RepID=A0A368T0M5_9ACTN|nr:VOC family protein [Marinitenerispora sediminis]RCV50960.1 glyxoylase [Marinitenerispora sediminis]RCV53131.1 glyxoylase [Marinitenerispora sediminis]RCV60423.1 glyxoylase [Marinitenerispora sediminis]
MTTVIPYLCVRDAAAALDFYRIAFDAVEDARWTEDDGRIVHAQFTIGEATCFVADEHPEIGVRAPSAYGGTPVSLVLRVADADATVARAVAAGATVEQAVADHPYHERRGWVVDPFGHRWAVNSRTEEVTEQELRERIGEERGSAISQHRE